MAMNKREQAELEEARTQAALRWTEPVLPDVQIPERGYAQGWQVCVAGGWIRWGWTESTAHGDGDYAQRRQLGGSQGGMPLYSSKDRALRALRNGLERKAAAALRGVDRMIAELEG